MARFILSKRKLLEQYNILNKLVFISYSLKTNIEVGKILEKETDCMFSVHSINELVHLADKKRAWFIGQAFSEEQLDNLFEMNIFKFIVDNASDLRILLDYIRKKVINIDLLLRVKLKEHTIFTGKYFVYGMGSKTVSDLIMELKENKNINKLGIHFHRKTQNTSEWSLKYELSNMFSDDVFEKIDIINIGGGLPANYKNISDKAVNYALDKIKELTEWLKQFNIRVIAEPGRFLAAPCIKLETEIIGMHEDNIIVDASVYNADTDSVFTEHLRLFVEHEVEKGSKSYTIKGCTPDRLDIFRYSVFFDKEPKVSDKVVFLNAGAYNFHTEFCLLDRIETVVVE